MCLAGTSDMQCNGTAAAAAAAGSQVAVEAALTMQQQLQRNRVPK
jgi:hypothetical protein